MKILYQLIIVSILLNSCCVDFDKIPSHLVEEDIISYMWTEPIPDQLANYYANPTDEYELSSPKLWNDYLIFYGVNYEKDEAKYFKLDLNDINNIEEWESFARPSVHIFNIFEAVSKIKDDMLIFAYYNGPLTIIDLNSMTTLYKSNNILSSEDFSILGENVIFEQRRNDRLNYQILDLNTFNLRDLYSTRHNNTHIFGVKQIPEFVFNESNSIDVISVEKTNDTTYFVQRINTNTLDTVWRTLCDQKNINNGPYHIVSDKDIVLASSFGHISTYKKSNGEYLYTLKRGNDKTSIEEPLIHNEIIICPTIDKILCFDKNTGNKLWELKDKYHPTSSYLNWGSSFENGIIEDSYFLSEYPINLNNGEPKWQIQNKNVQVEFTGMPAYDEQDNALYYTGPRHLYKISYPN